jgi:hypothetical protein
VRFQVLAAASVKMIVFLNVAICYGRNLPTFERCLLSKTLTAPKRRLNYTRLHGATYQKAAIFKSDFVVNGTRKCIRKSYHWILYLTNAVRFTSSQCL